VCLIVHVIKKLQYKAQICAVVPQEKNSDRYVSCIPRVTAVFRVSLDHRCYVAGAIWTAAGFTGSFPDLNVCWPAVF
jgi:hypothetical protein